MNEKKDSHQERHAGKWLRQNFLKGLAIIFPVFITLYLIVAFFQFIDGLAGDYINVFFQEHFGFAVPGLGFLMTIAVIFLSGVFYNYFFGKSLFNIFEKILMKIPLVANIYPSAKELSDFLFGSEKKEKFQKVVSVEFPQKDTYSIGFITNEHVREFDSAGQGDLVAVFVPLAPTPVTGFIILMSKEKVTELDMTIDKALRFIVSGGVVLSDEKKKDQEGGQKKKESRNDHDQEFSE